MTSNRSTEVAFILNGRRIRLTRSAVEKAMKGVQPEAVRALGVVVHGTTYPVKQVFATALKVDRLDFTSEVARRQLGHLGFQLVRTRRRP